MATRTLGQKKKKKGLKTMPQNLADITEFDQLYL